jgi:hypothetical protein
MSFFIQCEGDAAIVVENGVYKQCDLYTRDGYFYVKVGGGFVRLMVDGSTSKHRLRLDYLDTTLTLARDRVGRLCMFGVDDAILLDLKQSALLIGGAK